MAYFSDDLAIDPAQLDELWFVICEQKIRGGVGDDTPVIIDYNDYERIRERLADGSLKRILNSRTFSRLSCVSSERPIGSIVNGGIVADILVIFLKQYGHMTETLSNLSTFDSDKDGLLNLQDLESIVLAAAEEGPDFEIIPEHLHDSYAKYGSLKFQFLQGNKKNGAVRILDLACSPDMKELNAITDSYYDRNANWFSPSKFMTLHLAFLNLDSDGDGLIGEQELKSCTPWTDFFLSRVIRSQGKLSDFIGFAKLLIAYRYAPCHPRSTSYLFNILDADHKGYLDEEDMRSMYASLMRNCSSLNIDARPLAVINSVQVFLTAMYDMINLPYGSHISYEAVLKSGFEEVFLRSCINHLEFFTSYALRND